MPDEGSDELRRIAQYDPVVVTTVPGPVHGFAFERERIGVWHGVPRDRIEIAANTGAGLGQRPPRPVLCWRREALCAVRQSGDIAAADPGPHEQNTGG